MLTNDFGLTASDLVVDIGCNDASLLRCFQQRGVRTLGVDPARNLAEYAADSGVERYTGFFGAETAREIRQRWGEAQLIAATNTFPHLPRLDDFMSGIDILLAPGGRFVIEAHYLLDLVDQLRLRHRVPRARLVLGPAPAHDALRGARHGSRSGRDRLDLHHGQLRAGDAAGG